jgi:hypothetical protein
VRIGHQLHVGSLNTLPAGDRRTVESVAVLELVFVESADRHGHVLLLATGVGEAEVDELDSFSLTILITSCGLAIAKSPQRVPANRRQ